MDINERIDELINHINPDKFFCQKCEKWLDTSEISVSKDKCKKCNPGIMPGVYTAGIDYSEYISKDADMSKILMFEIGDGTTEPIRIDNEEVFEKSKIKKRI